MGRILAIDYGKKRVGLAVTDPLKLTTRILPYQPETNIRKWLLDYFEGENIESVVIGYPEHSDGTSTDLTKEIDLLLNYIKSIDSSVSLERSEESFTSKEAMSLMIKLGVSKKRRREKGLMDSYSALVILEEYIRNK